MSEKKMPKIRFPEFTGDWKQRKLEDICKKITDGSHFSPAEVEDGFPMPSVKDMTENGFNYDSCKKISAEDYEVLVKQGCKPEIGDVLVAKDGSILKYAFEVKENQDVVILSSIAILKPNNEMVNGGFLAQHFMIEDFKKRVIDENTTGTGVPRIVLTNFKNFMINYPSVDEQKKIAAFFENIDNLITLHQRKCNKIKEYKKGCLQKMFPKDGANVPEVRFPEFTDAWEQRKVSELCSISTGKSNTQDKVEDGEYPFYVRSPIIERSTKYLYDEEAVLTVGDGVGTGKVFHYVNGKYDLHQRCYRMYDFKDELNAHYFYHTFSKLFYKRVMAMTAKTSVDSVRLEMIADMEIPCPDIKEQEKIGAYFDTLDNLITLHQRECGKYKELKKGLLQQMFV